MTLPPRPPPFLIPVLLAAACGGEPDVEAPVSELATHEGVTEAHIDAMEEMADILDGIRDRKSAEAARPRMEEIAKRVKEINDAEANLGAPSAAERARLDARLESAAEMLEPRFRQAMERLKGDPDAVVLVATMMAEAAFPGGR